MKNWKKIILNDFGHWVHEEDGYVRIQIDPDNRIKAVIDDFMRWYEDSNQLAYINAVCRTSIDYVEVKKFLYLVYLDKYTGCIDFNNTDKDKMWDL